MIKLKTPNTYHGFGPSTSMRMTEQQTEDLNGFFVNGVLNISDGTFMHHFNISELPDTNIVIGPYPQSDKDVEKVA